MRFSLVRLLEGICSLQGDVGRKNIGHVLLLTGTEGLLCFFLLKIAEDGVFSGVNYTWTNIWLYYGKQLTKIFEFYSKLGLCLCLYAILQNG